MQKEQTIKRKKVPDPHQRTITGGVVHVLWRMLSAFLAICLFFLAANIANATVYWNQVISADSLAYAFAFLLLGITAMRRMQMGAEMPLNWRVRNALSVVGVPVLAVGLSLLLFFALRYSQMALRVILEPVGRFLIWLFHRLFPDGHSPVEEMSLQEFLKLGRGAELTGGRKLDSIVSDALEAVIGAIFLDGGFEEAKAFVYRRVLDDIENKRLFVDSKTNLQELVQEDGRSIEYRLDGEEGPAHDKTFSVTVLIGGEEAGSGSGHNKKTAEQHAAYAALLRLKKQK